jgi:small-conductance mechanosensitive channel
MPLIRFRTLVLTLIVIAATVKAVEAQPAPAAEAPVAMAPVTVDGIPLFRVRGVTSYPAESRARLIEERVVEAARDGAIAPESVTVVPGEAALRIVAGTRTLMFVADADAVIEGVSPAVLAATHVVRLRQAIADYRSARARPALMLAAWRTLVATALMAAVLLLVAWLWRRLDAILQRRVQARIHSVGIQSFEVVRADQIRGAVDNVRRGLRAIVFVVATLVYASYVLALWPWTRGLSHGAAGLVVDPLLVLGSGLVANIPRLGFLVVLFVMIRLILRVIRMFFEAIASGGVTLANFDAEWAQPTYKIVRLAIVALGVIVAYPYIPGSESDAFKGVSLFVGIVFSLGSSSAIANIIAGYMMTYRRAFKVGDRIRIGDSTGDVILARLQVTHLRSVKNEEIVIPNSQILGQEVINYSSLAREGGGLLLHSEVAIGYDTPWRQVEALLLLAAARTHGLGHEPVPFVLVKRLGEFSIVYEVNVPCVEIAAMGRLYSALHQNILDVFNEYGVQIMVPAYEGDPPEPKLVAPANWNASPAPAPSRPATPAPGNPVL